MDTFIAITLVALAYFAGILANLIASEICDYCPSLARQIITYALRWLPPYKRQQREQEWHAHLLDYPGRLSQVGQACRCAFAALVIGHGDDLRKLQTSFVFAVYVIMIERNRFLWSLLMQYFVLVFFEEQCPYRKLTVDPIIEHRLDRIAAIVESYADIRKLFVHHERQLLAAA